MGSRIPVEEGTKDLKNKWKWQIRVDQLRDTNTGGVLVQLIGGSGYLKSFWYTTLPELIDVTTGAREQEFELIDKLTTNKGAFGASSDSLLYKILKHYQDGLYRLVIYKQTNSSRMRKNPIFAFWGYCLVSKNADMILWETRYFQCGNLVLKNLETRNPIEDTRNTNVDKIPSGGVDMLW